MSPLDVANAAFVEGKYAAAEVEYRQIVETETNAAIVAKALFNLGVTLRKQDRLSEAVDVFQKIFATGADDREPGENIMEIYRNYRHQAQWEIARCQYDLREFDAAMVSFQNTLTKFPVETWCGNERAGSSYDASLWIGYCLEQKGDVMQAVQTYFTSLTRSRLLVSTDVAQDRVIQIYGELGRARELVSMIESGIAQDVTNLAELVDGLALENDLTTFRGAWLHFAELQVLKKMKMREAAVRKEWSALTAYFGATRCAPNVIYSLSRSRDTECYLAAELLAHYPAETVPVLAKELEHAEPTVRAWVLYALGLCATSESLELVKQAAADTHDWKDLDAIILALRSSGEAGHAILDEFTRSGSTAMKDAISEDVQIRDELSIEDHVKLPALSPDVVVPSSWKELTSDPRWVTDLRKK